MLLVAALAWQPFAFLFLGAGERRAYPEAVQKSKLPGQAWDQEAFAGMPEARA